MAVAVLGLRYASDKPDGLERVASDQGIASTASTSGSSGVLHGWTGAFIGVGLTFFVTAAVVVGLRRSRST